MEAFGGFVMFTILYKYVKKIYTYIYIYIYIFLWLKEERSFCLNSVLEGTPSRHQPCNLQRLFSSIFLSGGSPWTSTVAALETWAGLALPVSSDVTSCIQAHVTACSRGISLQSSRVATLSHINWMQIFCFMLAQWLVGPIRCHLPYCTVLVTIEILLTSC